MSTNETKKDPRAMIQRGMKGPRVLALQSKLLSLGYILPKYGIDGDPGPEFFSAVDNFAIERRIVPCPDKNGKYKTDPTRDAIQALVLPLSVEDRILAEPADTLRGADFSQYQGEVDWEAFSGSGMRFLWIRGSIGRGGLDKAFARNWNGARAAQTITLPPEPGQESGEAGVKELFKIGMYHLWLPESDPVEQAENILRVAGPLLRVGDLRVALDVEGECKMSGEDVSARLQKTIDKLMAFDGLCRFVGVKKAPVVYTSARICREWGLTSGGEGPVWLANYTQGRREPPVPEQWAGKGWNVWQTGYGGRKGAGRGSIPGVSTDLDRNLLRGGEAGLKLICY